MRADGLPVLETYEEALHRYNNTAPIRGTEVRPLGRRRDHGVFRIEKHGVAIVCIMWSTPIVTYYPNGTVQLRTGGWDTPTTAQALRRLLGRIGHVYSTGGRLVIRLKEGEFPVDGLVLQKGESVRYVPTNAEPCVVHKINRAKAKAVRQQYAAFLTYAKGVLSLMSDDDGEIDARALDGWDAPFPHMTIDGIQATDDPDADVARWHTAVTRALLSNRRTFVRTMDVMGKINEAILKAHASEVFEKEVLPLGVLKKDKYAGWV